jgi:hypothetical protein
MIPLTLRSWLLLIGIVTSGVLARTSASASDRKLVDPPVPPVQASQPAAAPASAPAPAPTVRAAPGTPPSPECAWTGQRIVMALLRDDVIAAEGFLGFYSRFGCPDGHLGRAFGCAVPLANAEAAPKRQHIAACWLDPDTAAPAKAPARAEKEEAKPGEGENKEGEKPAAPGTTR